ncbi:MAG TPA: DivIVA domain-containing protein [Solirubrobacteraceae bacterium]|jgi:cell division septum initiation protein DivIVA|nr:DivIVA domain-containing protein [Solirubrobacteraceae bacterium]
MTDLETKSPEFASGIRGYDRAQVDEYIDYLRRLITDAEERARDAQSQFVLDQHAAIGPRIAEIFALAEAEAREMRDTIASQSTGLVDAARKEAREIVVSAKREAAEIREHTERDHVVLFAELEQERERIREEVAVLERCKAEAIGELNHLREMLGEAAGVVGQVAEIRGRRAPKQLTGPGDETVEMPAVAADLGDA